MVKNSAKVEDQKLHDSFIEGFKEGKPSSEGAVFLITVSAKNNKILVEKEATLEEVLDITKQYMIESIADDVYVNIVIDRLEES